MVLTQDDARTILQQAIPEEEVVQRDLDALDTALRKEAWHQLGIKRFESVQNFFSAKARQALADALEK